MAVLCLSFFVIFTCIISGHPEHKKLWNDGMKYFVVNSLSLRKQPSFFAPCPSGVYSGPLAAWGAIHIMLRTLTVKLQVSTELSLKYYWSLGRVLIVLLLGGLAWNILVWYAIKIDITPSPFSISSLVILFLAATYEGASSSSPEGSRSMICRFDCIWVKHVRCTSEY